MGQSPKRRVPVGSGTPGSIGEHLDHVLRRPGLGVPASEIDKRLAVQGSR